MSTTTPAGAHLVALHAFMVGGLLTAAITEARKGGFSREVFLRQADRAWAQLDANLTRAMAMTRIGAPDGGAL